MTKKSFFSDVDQAIGLKNLGGVFSITYQYGKDDQGAPTMKLSCFAIDGKPASVGESEGPNITSYLKIFGNNGFLSEMKFYNKDNVLTNGKHGYAIQKYGYTAQGRMTAVFDANNQPINIFASGKTFHKVTSDGGENSAITLWDNAGHKIIGNGDNLIINSIMPIYGHCNITNIANQYSSDAYSKGTFSLDVKPGKILLNVEKRNVNQLNYHIFNIKQTSPNSFQIKADAKDKNGVSSFITLNYYGKNNSNMVFEPLFGGSVYTYYLSKD